MALPQDLIITEWSDPAQVPEITRLLHLAYAPLAEAGLRFLATHQDEETTLARLSQGRAFLVLDGSKIVGTVALSLPGQLTHCEVFRRPGVQVFHQFAVDPERQGEGIGGALLDYLEWQVVEMGGTHLACDTAEPALHLVAIYKKRGFEIAGHAEWEVTNYRSVLLLKSIG